MVADTRVIWVQRTRDVRHDVKMMKNVETRAELYIIATWASGSYQVGDIAVIARFEGGGVVFRIDFGTIIDRDKPMVERPPAT